MNHVIVRSAERTLLFRTWSEARALWDRLTRELPGLRALMLLPDRVHLVHPDDVGAALGRATGGYTRWRNHRRGDRGPAFDPLRDHRCLHDLDVAHELWLLALAPLRVRLVSDPLAWPFSTYRDQVDLPLVRSPFAPTPDRVLHVVSSLTRTPLPTMRASGPARSLYLHAARALCDETPGRIAARVGCSARAGLSIRPSDVDLDRVRRVVGDPRFEALHDGDLRRLPSWRRYRRRR